MYEIKTFNTNNQLKKLKNQKKKRIPKSVQPSILSYNDIFINECNNEKLMLTNKRNEAHGCCKDPIKNRC